MTDAAYLLVHEDREYLLEPGEEFGTDLGVLEVPEDVAAGDTVESHLGTAFEVRELRGPDLFDHLERTGAPMMPRDVGLVMGLTGVSAGDRVLDAGTGTGILAAHLGRVGADVTTYEIDPEFADVARENMRVAGVTERVEVRTGDLAEEIDALVDGSDDGDDDEAAEPAEPPAPFDVLTLDTGDAPAVVARAPDVLVSGGFVAVYSPFVEGTREAVTAAREAGLAEIETLETIQREMDFSDRGSRPSTRGVGHTGYLVIARAP
ncbi:tRNA (adenine57-N1/adenine58-N1)-methyltransferase [Halorubrum aquaticum]|uniref:tRNA (Adenine57-N1/adenine58-N1)-methyltransferase n=1 Tax=Halorubrum aquaticum TaxID=387340 RepID=A0A1I3AZS4_9EURY|nr:methyltransferase domain-containing protein [Halorubrum aquaticum]SFH55575.1 tRNA (adenine57-N1/adenine58-N1)-methyltransferase [Halorubrum aquaticum]